MEDSEVNRLVDEDAQLLHSRLQASCSLPVARLIVKKFTDFSSDAWGSEEERDEVLEMAYDWCTTDDGRRLLRVAQQLYSGIENHKLLQVAKVIADVFPEGMAPEVTERVRACCALMILDVDAEFRTILTDSEGDANAIVRDVLLEVEAQNRSEVSDVEDAESPRVLQDDVAALLEAEEDQEPVDRKSVV